MNSFIFGMNIKLFMYTNGEFKEIFGALYEMIRLLNTKVLTY